MNRRLLLVLAVHLLLLGACASGEGNGMRVEGVWGRPSPQAAENGAFYLSVTNESGSDDALLAVRTERCGAIELHQTEMDEAGVMRMRPVEGGRIPVANGETVVLRPGGQHVMCIGVASPLTLGEEVPLTLVFANMGEMVVTAEIRQEEP